MKLYVYRYTNNDRKITEQVVEVRETEKTLVAVNDMIPTGLESYMIKKIRKEDCCTVIDRCGLTYYATKEAYHDAALAFLGWYEKQQKQYQKNAEIMKENTVALAACIQERTLEE